MKRPSGDTGELQYTYNYGWQVLLSQGNTLSSGSIFWIYSSTANTAPPKTTPLLLDWNGDGCTDISVAYAYANWSLYRSDCNGGFFAGIATGIPSAETLLTADWDSDGRGDILHASGTSHWLVLRSNGETGFTSVDTQITPGSNPWFVSDLNGDGLADLGWMDQGAGNAIKYNLHNGAFTPPDLAISFTDGFGMNQSPVYVSINQSSYTKYNTATFPEADYQGSLYVVNQFSASDGTGGTYQNKFSYYGARTQLQGRGFEGFYTRRTFDNRNLVYTYDYLGQAFPYTGTLSARSTTLDSIHYLNYSTSVLSAAVTGGSGYESRYFPNISQKTDSQYEYGGTKGGNLIKQVVTAYTYDDGYGNPTQIVTSTTDQDSTAPVSPFNGQTWTSTVVNVFNNNTTTWCLGLPTSTTVQNTAPGQTTQTRSYSSTVDSSYCRITQQVIEPNTAALSVTTGLGFDSCGNVNSVAITGHNPDGTAMPTRTTAFNYSYLTSRCQLPELIQNAIGQSSTISYQYDFGVATQVTDPNGVTVSWQYDDFGRKKRETRANGTSTSWARSSCASPPCWGIPDARFMTQRSEQGQGGISVSTQQFIYDGINRLRYEQSQHVLSNGALTNDHVYAYDALGRVTYDYQPYSTAGNGYRVYSYDPLNRITTASLYQSNGTLDRITSFNYFGLTSTVTDPLIHVTTRVNDVMGNLRRIADPSPGGTTSYDFDVFGNLNKITDANGKISSAAFNLRGFKTQMVDADSGTWNFQGDSLNELLGWTDAKSQSFSATYDALGRMITNEASPQTDEL